MQNLQKSQPIFRTPIFSKFRSRAPIDDLVIWFSDSRPLEKILVEFDNTKLERGEFII